MDSELLQSLPLPPEILAAIAVGAVLLLVIAVVLLRRSSAGLEQSPEPAEIDDGVAGAVATPALPARPPDAGARFFAGFARSRAALADSLSRLFGAQKVDEELLEGLEETLILTDVGVRTAASITDVLRQRASKDADGTELRALLRDELRARVGDTAAIATQPAEGPLAILVVGVNGSGKTTTIGKLAARYQRAGKRVMLAAGDTFRAGAIEQLRIWGDRAGVAVVAHQEGGDPAAVIFDALHSARAKDVDIVICDTAGRLQAQKLLMDELSKVVRVMDKALPGSPHEVLLVLDGTIGQNALSQARIFKEVVGVTGVVLTKLDGTARGGVVVAVHEELGLPVKHVGLGEGIDDLRDFDPDAFVHALMGEADDAAI